MMTAGSVTRSSSISVIPLATAAHATTRAHPSIRRRRIFLVEEEEKVSCDSPSVAAQIEGPTALPATGLSGALSDHVISSR